MNAAQGKMFRKRKLQFNNESANKMQKQVNIFNFHYINIFKIKL